MSTTTPIEKFPAHKLDAARHALGLAHARLMRSAMKAGQSAPAAPTLTVRTERVFSRCARCKRQFEGFSRPAHGCGSTDDDAAWSSISLVDLELVADRPALAGWVFLAVVEPLEGGNLIRQVPGADVAQGELASWAAGKIACDHCATQRRRAETFIVRADGTDPAVPAGTYRQVGRQCVTAFLGGKSCASIVAQLAWPDVIRGVGDEDGDGGWGGDHSVQRVDPVAFLAQTAAKIRLDGWTSRSAARAAGGQSTSDRALYLMTPPFGGDPRGDWRREVERCRPSAEDHERGAAALQWARDLAGETDYERSLSLVARQPGLRAEHAGILASAVSAHTRMLGREVERGRLAAAASSNPSAHVGRIGEQMNLELTVQRVAPRQNDYGALNIISMRDQANNLFVWKTGTRNPKPGDRIRVRGSVKSHNQYRGEKQTILTRCRIVDEFPPDKKSARVAHAPRARKTAPAAPAWSAGDEVSWCVLAGPDGGQVRTGTILGTDGPLTFVERDGQVEAVSASLLRVADPPPVESRVSTETEGDYAASPG